MLRNLASALFLTEEEPELLESPPAVRGRVITTLAKAKEARPLVERCIRIACTSLQASKEAEQYATTAERGTAEYKQWRTSETWQKWCQARAPLVNGRRRVLQLIGDRRAVETLFETIAPRFMDRPGGYNRVLRLAKPRLGDAGPRAILELVGRNDRVADRSERPAFEEDAPTAGADSTTAAPTAEPAATEGSPAPEQDAAVQEAPPQE